GRRVVADRDDADLHRQTRRVPGTLKRDSVTAERQSGVSMTRQAQERHQWRRGRPTSGILLSLTEGATAATTEHVLPFDAGKIDDRDAGGGRGMPLETPGGIDSLADHKQGLAGSTLNTVLVPEINADEFYRLIRHLCA